MFLIEFEIAESMGWNQPWVGYLSFQRRGPIICGLCRQCPAKAQGARQRPLPNCLQLVFRHNNLIRQYKFSPRTVSMICAEEPASGLGCRLEEVET